MADEKTELTQNEVAQNTRRTFVKKAAQVAVTAPAVVVLLNATTKPAEAAPVVAYTGNDFGRTAIAPVDDSAFDDVQVITTTGDDFGKPGGVR